MVSWKQTNDVLAQSCNYTRNRENRESEQNKEFVERRSLSLSPSSWTVLQMHEAALARSGADEVIQISSILFLLILPFIHSRRPARSTHGQQREDADADKEGTVMY